MSYLQTVTTRLKGIDEVSTGVGVGLAHEIEELITTGSAAQLRALHGNIQELVLKIKELAPTESSALADRNTAAYGSFLLGQFNFAGLLVSQVAEQRGDDDFVQFLQDRAYRDLLNILLKRDAAGNELARELNLREETVSRKLRVLRDKGAVEFRREGNRIVNFLTPAARHALSDLIEPVDGRLLQRRFAQSIIGELDTPYQSTPKFQKVA